MLKSISKSSLNMKQIYSVDGNIACGKSMILDHLASNRQHQNTHCMQEPVAEWTNMKSGTDLLGSFYSDKERWSFPFENLVQLSRLKAHYQSFKLIQSQPFYQQKDTKKGTKIFLERSIYSSFYVFSQNTFDDGGFSAVEFDILKEYFKFFTNDLNRMYSFQEKMQMKENLNPNQRRDQLPTSDPNTNTVYLPFKLIYIRSDPGVCYERLKLRDRLSEDLIDENYLRDIHEKYENWVSRISKECLVVIDGNQDKAQVLKQIDDLIYNN